MHTCATAVMVRYVIGIGRESCEYPVKFLGLQQRIANLSSNKQHLRPDLRVSEQLLNMLVEQADTSV